MEGLNVVSISCPRGQFSAPAYCDADSYSLQAACAASELQQQPGSQLLEQLQDCNGRAQRLLTLLSIHREQGIASYTDGLDRLFSEALACVVQALQTAAAAKQPLLTASSQHSSCFCKLLERLHLLDALWKASNNGPTPGAQAQQLQQQPVSGEIEPATAQGAAQCPATPFINQLESTLRGTPGLDAVLAALIAHAQQNAATGSKLAPGALAPASSKQEVLEVSSLSAVQEHHSSARALPLLIRLYFNTGSRAETIATGRPEPLSAKLLERALAVLATKPVVPGCADVPVCLTSGLHACQGLSELAAARKLKLPTELGKLDFKAAFKLDQSYSLQDKVLPLLQQHDELCDLLSQLALEIQQAVAVERDIDPKALDSAEQFVAGSISFAAAARNSLLDLDAWRLSTCGAGTDSATPTSARACQDQCLEGFLGDAGDTDSTCDRYKLKDDDVVPFLDVLGAIKGLTGLLADSSAWLQPLLHEHAVKQLNEFAFFTLPALSKLYSRNPRLQDLLRAIYACMQGQFVEVGEDVDAAAVPSPAAAAAAEAALAAASEVQQQTGQPLGEGFEGFKERWGSLKGAARKQAQKQAAAAAAAPPAAALESPPGADAGSSGAQQLALAEPSEAAEGCDAADAAIASVAAADLEAATAAAEAAAANRSGASSPCSVSQVEVAAAEQAQVPASHEQDLSSVMAETHKVSDSASADGTATSGEAAAASDAAVKAVTPDEASVEPASAPAESQAAAAAAAQQVVPSQASRKRTLKGLFKFKTSGRKRDKAAVQAAAVEETAAAAVGAAANPAAAEAEGSSTATGEQPTEPATLSEAQQDSLLHPGSRPGSAKARRRQPAPPCLATAWTDSENDMPLCHIRMAEVSALPSAASSMTDLNSAGFERPPDLPWELQGAAAVASDDSPRSVARAAAMFERIAAANRQPAGAPRLSSAGREVAGGSKSSPGGWDAAVGTPPAARLTEVAGSPVSREELLSAVERDAEQHPGEFSCDDSPVAITAMQQQDDGSAETAAKAAKKRQGLFGFRSLLPSRAAAEAQQGQQQSSGQEDTQALDAAEDKRLATVQWEKEQLAEQLQDKQEVALLSGQELEEDLQGCAVDDAAIPASWGPSPVSPKDEKHEGRMKEMLSMLRRGGARTASLGAAAALQGETTVAAATAASTAEQQLAELSVAAAAAEFGADGIVADADVAGSQCGSQPDASEDFDEDQPAKTRRVMGLMNRIRVFTQGAKEQQPQQPAMQQPQLPQQTAESAGNRQGLKGLTFTAKLKKAMGDRRQSRFADTVGADGQTSLPLEAMPSAACLQLLRVLLELLMHEIKAETKKHLMMQLQMAAAAAAGSAGVSKPDASIARPLKQVKQMIKAVHRMQLMVDFPQQLLAAADLSDLWVGASCGSNLAAMAASAAPQQAQADAAGAGSSRAAWQSAGSATKQQQVGSESVKASVDMSPPSPKGLHPWSLYNLLFEETSECSLNEGVRNSLGALSLSRANRSPRNPDAAADSPRPQRAEAGGTSIPVSNSSGPAVLPYISSFSSALIAACMQHLERMPCELPLLALQVLWDARRLLKGCGLLSNGLELLQEQERLCMCCYMQHLVPTAYEHFKRIAGHQTVTAELLRSCKAPPLQPVKQLYLDSLLREPCPLVMQADYAAIAAEAMATLQPGKMAEADAQLAQTLGELADTQQALQQQKAMHEVEQAVQQLQKAEQEVQLAEDAQQGSFGAQEERPVSDQLDPAALRFSGVFTAAKPSPSKGVTAPAVAAGPSPGPTAGAGRGSRKKRHGRASQHRTSGTGALAAGAAVSGDGTAEASSSKGERPAGVTPLMQKLEAMGAAHEVEAAAGRYNERRCLQAWGACELDVRQWLLAGMLQSLQQDAELVVVRCSHERPAAVVQSQLQAAILQRTHALMSQYFSLPLSWDQIWQQADTQQPLQDATVDSGSCTAAVTVAGLLHMLDTAVYDAEAQVLLSVVLPAAADSGADGLPQLDGVLVEVEAAVQPLQGFFGRQHLAALHGFTGPAGVQQLIAGVLDKLEHEQVLLLEELLSLQQQLPPSLLQMPPAEECHSAGAVLQFYQQQLSNALEDHAACAGALGSLQRIGNCLALLHLVSVQQAVQATPQFMQVAPLLGIVGRPMTDAAAAAECFEGEDLPAPPPAVASAAAAASGCQNLSRACTPGLLMPEVETLLPSDHTRHTHEMQALKELHQEDVCRWEARQAGLPLDNTLVKPGGELARHRVWQASHFQRLLLGPDAEKVRGPAMLLTQKAELRAWRATEGIDVLGPCLEKLQVWAVQLQQQLQGERPTRRSKGGRSKRAVGAGEAAAGDRKSRRRQHRSKQRQQDVEQQVGLSQRQQRAISPAHATAAAGGSAMSAEPSAESFGQMTDRTTNSDLTEVEQQLHALQAQVNAALIAAEERLRVVSMSPPQALLTEVRPRMQLPPEPIPFSLTQDAADGSAVSVMQLQGSGLMSEHPAAALEAEDSVEQASPKDGTFSADEAPYVAPDSEASAATAASSDTSSPVPALLTEQELAAAAEAAAAAAAEAGYPDPWEVADSDAAQQLTPGSAAPAPAQLAYRQLLTPAALGAAEDGGVAVLQHLETVGKSRLSSGRTGLAELVEEFSELSNQQQSQPDSRADEATSGDDGLGHEKDEGSFDDSAAGSPSQLSPVRPVFVSCPGRCESVDGDAGSASDAGTASQSPKSPWRATRSPSTARGAFDTEGSYLMSQAAAQQERWEGSPDSRQGSPVRYATPPMTELLYDTTVDELVRVKDERDMLMSEVEVLRNQLKNRNNTLAMLSGQMLITPRTSAADCESLMRAALSECSIGSLAMRSQPTASGIPSQPSNTISMGASTTGTLSMRRATSATPVASAEGSAASAAAARMPQPQGSDRQLEQQSAGRPRSAPRPVEPRSCETSAPVSSEPSKVSMRVQQATPCADINTVEGVDSGAEPATCSSSDTDSEGDMGSEDGAGSSSSYTDDSSDEEGVISLDEACLISTAGCGASRKLKMPQTVKAARRSSSISTGENPSPWPPAQLAVALSALKFVLLLDVAMTEDSAAAGTSQDGQGSAGGAQAQLSPLKRLKRAVEGVAAAAAAVTQQQAAEVAASKQRAAARGSGRMTTAQYGDGPLLATAVLLQLSGQSRRFDVLDATGRIAYWVEYDAVKSSSSAADAAAGDAAAAAAGVLSPRGAGAASMASSGVAAIVGAPGGIGAAAEGIAAPKPRSKKRQEEEAEALARERAAAAAQQQLLERLAAAHRQAARITRDGSSLAARFAPTAPARSQKVRLRVFRVDGAFVQQMRAGGGSCLTGCASPGRITFGGGAFSAGSGGGSAENPKVPAVPVRAATLQYLPRQQPWSCVQPTQRPIQTHPSLPMARPQPLLLTTGPEGPARGGGVAEAGFAPPAVAGLPREAAIAAAAAAAAGTGIVGPSGRLLTGASVAPRAGLVAAARVMAAREVVLQTVPRNAAYSFSVVSDQNRSGRPEDGYSMAPSSADLDSIGSESPRRSPHRPSFMSAAVGASAARLGGRQRADGSTNMEQWLAGGSPAGAAAAEASFPPKAGLSRSSAKRTMSSQPSMLARAFGQ